MPRNNNLLIAKKNKNDEFYTRYEDIEKELQYYTEELKDKIIYCNCDDYRVSNFVKYFYYNFETTGIKLLIATNYNIGEGSYEYRYDGLYEYITEIEDGSYNSERCLSILNEADIIITNPPFSKFRDYIKVMMDNNKKILVVGNGNAVIYKDIFPYIKNNELWLGASKGIGGNFSFIVPESYEGKFVSIENGDRIGQVNNACWFTNIPHTKTGKPLILTKTYNETDYPKYDNYDAIEVSRVENIPMDYVDGVMGVPITFLDKYCPTQFEILGVTNNAKENAFALKENTIGYSTWASINGKNVYARILIKKKDELVPVEFEIF